MKFLFLVFLSCIAFSSDFLSEEEEFDLEILIEELEPLDFSSYPEDWLDVLANLIHEEQNIDHNEPEERGPYTVTITYEDSTGENKKPRQRYCNGNTSHFENCVKPPEETKKVNSDENLALTTLEACPSSIVANCVSAISGDYVESCTDLVVPGAIPLAVQRTYCSSAKTWNYSHKAELNVKPAGARHLRISYTDDHGAELQLKNFASKYAKNIFVPAKMFDKGVTNCGSGEISGKTNLNNIKMFFIREKGEKLFDLQQGSKNKKIFSHAVRRGEHHRQGPSVGKYFLKEDRHPNGNTIKYGYDNCHHLNSITGINRSGKSLESITVEPNWGPNFDLAGYQVDWKSKNSEVTYTFDNFNEGKIRETFPYHAIPMSYEYTDGRITQKNLPDGRFLQIKYSKNQDSWRKNPVWKLLAPVGKDQTPICTHTFSYGSEDVLDWEISNGKKVDQKFLDAHKTVVEDAHKNKTVYYYTNNNKRLHTIHKHDENKNILITDRFYWIRNGNLKARTFAGDDKIHFCRTLDYDKYGNVKEEELWGNLTGKNSCLVEVDKEGVPLKNGCECYVKRRKFTKDGWDLLLEEDDGRKKTVCGYYDNSNLLKYRFTLDGSKILKREFFEYDDSGALVKEIWDDGTEEDQNNLSNIAQRHIKLITLTTKSPIGLPEIVEEKYFDKESSTDVLLKKDVYAYSLQGKVIEQKHYGSDNQLAYTLSWDYDNLGNVTKQVNAIEETSIFKYDANGNKIFEQGPNDELCKTFTYDFANRLIKEEETWKDGQQFTITHRYNTLSQRIETVDIYGHKTFFKYDALGRLTETQLPPVYDENDELKTPTERTKYDAMGNAIAKWDAEDFCTHTQYTIRGQPFHIEYPDGSVEQKFYTLDGLLEREIAKNSLIKAYKHDALGRVILTETMDPQEKVLKTIISTYNSSQLISETDEEGFTTTYTYDGAGRKISMTKGDHVTQYEYDVLGRIVKTTEAIDDHSARVTIKEYDFLDRVIEERIEDQDNQVLHKERYSYNEQGKRKQVIAYTHAGEASTDTTYLSNGEVSSVTDALSNKTHITYEYDHIHKDQRVLRSISTDPLGNQEIKIYDTHHRVSNLLRQNSSGEITQSETYVYDLNGQKKLSKASVYSAQEEPRTIVTEWEYDKVGNVICCTEAKGTPEQKVTIYHYNLYGQKDWTKLANGITLFYTYDSLGLLKTYTSSDGSIDYKYTYDLKDNPKLVENLVHNTCTHRSYDKFGRLESENLDNGCTLTYTYDQLDRPLSVTLPDKTTIIYRHNALYVTRVERNSFTHSYEGHDFAGNVFQENMIGQAGTITYKYDLLERPIYTIKPKWQEAVLEFDPVGNLLQRNVVDDQGPLEYTYTYDDLYQLISETGAESHRYQNDSLYNRIEKDNQAYVLNDLNQLLKQKNVSYLYDDNGNLKEKTSDSETVKYRYDALDRLIEVENGSDITAYAYDSFHRRLAKTRNGTTTQFLYQGQNEIGTLVDGKITQLRILGTSQGAEIGAAIGLELHGNLYVPIHDSFGNIVAVLDTSGNVVESYRYTAFGEIQTFGNAAIDNPWTYSSKRFDSETGFFFFGRRYYAPEIGRWITPDPLGFEDGPNLYAYVHNQPLAFIDPDGQFAVIVYVAYVAATTAIGMAAECALPSVVAYLGESATGIAVSAFVTGAVKGYNGSTFEPCLYAEAGWLPYACEIAGKAVTTAPSLLKPQNASKNMKSLYGLATREVGILAQKGAQEAVTSITKNTIKNATNQTTQKTIQFANKAFGKKQNLWVFPENPKNLLRDLPRDPKGRIYVSDNIRIRPEKHALQPNEIFNPRHHGQHYHVETRHDPMQSWNKKCNVMKIEPRGYSIGDGTGFLPGEYFPGVM